MADVHTPQQRSFNMSRIRSKDTQPELLVRRYLHSNGFRYKLYDKSLPGKPDIVLPRYKTVIFIHGCFFHGHLGCRYFVLPKTRTDWWFDKISSNRKRDAENESKLSEAKWQVIKIYECELKPAYREQTLINLIDQLKRIKV